MAWVTTARLPVLPGLGRTHGTLASTSCRRSLTCSSDVAVPLKRATQKDALYQALRTARLSCRIAKDAPLTPVDLDDEQNSLVREVAEGLEAMAPSKRPLADSPQLVDGCWLLLYSDAREITSLASLPMGFRVTRVEQNIKLANFSFENFGFVSHKLGLLTGYVNIKAIFTPSLPPRTVRSAKLLSSSFQGAPSVGRRLTISFQQRIVVITRLLSLLPIPKSIGQVFHMEVLGGGRAGPERRVPTLDVTYLDEDIRIGRGGEQSIFVLQKIEKSAAS